MILSKRCWYPAFVIYRWRHVMWLLPALALVCLLVLHWNRLRWDHAMAVVQLCPPGASSFAPARSSPAPYEDLPAVIHSSPVLSRAVRLTALDGIWQTGEAQAAERLRSLVILDPVPGTDLIEVKVRKIPAGDSREVCEAIVKSAQEQAKTEVVAKASAEIACWRAEAKGAETKLNEIRAGWREDDANKRRSSKESVDRFNEHLRELELIRAKVLADELDLLVMEAPFSKLAPAHWPGRPATRHLQHFGISAAWTFGVSGMLAIALAYLLEALVPRKRETDEIIPEGEPAHEYS